jgi:hypothetical protein
MPSSETKLDRPRTESSPGRNPEYRDCSARFVLACAGLKALLPLEIDFVSSISGFRSTGTISTPCSSDQPVSSSNFAHHFHRIMGEAGLPHLHFQFRIDGMVPPEDSAV